MLRCFSCIVFVVFLDCSFASFEEELRRLAARVETLERQDEIQRLIIQQQQSRISVLEKTAESQAAVLAQLGGTSAPKPEVLKPGVVGEITANGKISSVVASKKFGTKGPRIQRQTVINYETLAFHAVITTGLLAHQHINQKLVFDSVPLNIGNGFNQQTGVFTATMPGVYLFSLSVMSSWDAHGENHVFIVKNGASTAAVYADGRSGTAEQGSVTIAMQLKVGDEVYVSFQRHDDVTVYGDGLTSFSGLLITPL